MWPLPIVCRIGQDHRKVKSDGYISCPEDALMPINGEVDNSGIALTTGRHGMVEVDHYPRIEELTRSHKWF